ncbi:MAG: hypothetical protein AAFU79_06740 [Myxococcota bacterium]
MRIEERTPVSEESKAAGYEVTDAQPSPVVVGMLVLVVLMFSGFVGGKVFEDIFEATEVRSRPAVGPLEIREKVSGPLLQPHPEVELEDYLEAQKRKLSSYAWVDRDQGKVQVPIERAMQLVAEKGLPTWKPVDAKLPEKKAAPAPAPVETSSSEGSEAAPAAESAGAEAPAEAAAGAESAAASGAAASEASESTDFTGTESLPE